MTFFYFINCCALTYGPYALIYKNSVLSEYQPYRKCLSVASMYMMTVMLRMFLLGTIVPIIGLDGTARDVVQPLVSIIDIVGIYYALARTGGRPEIKILSVLVGWGLTDALLSTLLVYWSGARKHEFSWEFVEMAVGYNVELVQLAATVTLVWLWTRTDLNQSAVPVISTVLLISLLKSFISKLVVAGGIMTCGLAANAIITAGVATVALSLFLSLTAE
ncbi:Oidioi.mRNA.OKI2018_I69.chr1.g2276.t1.cds [Oikopleura dioica]|uniref:BOS complex subunit TMEM147 n=1 Tax=Oikopleura dioica TaxID=34765 RepID=A0ABN7SQM4_OIKDI|nr:Oidioi.mRNA.OKI2018_I69.chr1.g2276.t1.cds [Oikopleura dioica]